jgi:hypothetical protein
MEGRFVMTMESTRDWLSDTRPEQPWRPADYLPLATDSSTGSDSGAAEQAFFVVTPEQSALIARLRGRIAALERQLHDLLDQLQRMRSEQVTLQQLSAMVVGDGRHPSEEWVRSHCGVGTQEQRNASPHLLLQTISARSA